MKEINGIKRDYRVPAKDLAIEGLIQKLEGPLNKNDEGPLGKAFLERFGKPFGKPRRILPQLISGNKRFEISKWARKAVPAVNPFSIHIFLVSCIAA